MSFASKRNRGGINWGIDTKGFPYFSLSELYDKNGKDCTYFVRGLYINKKSKYGFAPVVISDDFYVNLPTHMLGNVEEILSDAEDISTIKAGKVLFKIRPYTMEEGGRIFYTVDWVDLDDAPDMAYTE